MTENERLAFETELGISIDKNEDCPTMSICWNCDIPPRRCNYFRDAIDKLAKYEVIGTIEEFKALKEKNEPAKVTEHETLHFVHWQCGNCGAEFYSGQKFCDECGHPADWGDLLK